jgi:hypothetical protein
MKLSAILLHLSFAMVALSAAIKRKSPAVARGVDVVKNQPSIDFTTLAAAGNNFVYIWNSEDWPGMDHYPKKMPLPMRTLIQLAHLSVVYRSCC